MKRVGQLSRLLGVHRPPGLGLNAAASRYGMGQQVTLSLVAAWRDACPDASGAKTVTLWPEDVSDPALGSLRVEEQQGLLGPWLEKDPPPLAL